jgi:hypothetical protein
MCGKYSDGGWYKPLSPIPVSCLIPPDGKGHGLKGNYFNNKNLSGKLGVVRIDEKIDFFWGEESPARGINPDCFSVRWTGKLTLPKTKKIFKVGVTTDDGVRLFIDDKLVIGSWYDRPPTTDTISLKGGRSYDIRIEYYENYGGATARLEWDLETVPFDPTIQYGFYTEGNAWQWTFFVPHDVQGLINLFGGKEKFIEKLDAMFEQPAIVKATPDVTGLIGQYAHGNEPSHHIIYLYNHAGVPWKAQERARQVMEELYGIKPKGLCGNEDCGQMSAWYVFSAMGFYPTCPGKPTYDITSPIFGEVNIHFSEKIFTIKTNNVSKENKYIQSVTLNGKPLNKPWIEHADLVNGGLLIFEMGSKPNKGWGSS